MNQQPRPDDAAVPPPDVSRRLFLGRSAQTLVVVGGAAAIVAANTNVAEAARRRRRFPQETNFRSIQTHENAHVDALLAALGAAARPKPTFQGLEQPNFATFTKVSQALENTGVGAYLGAAPFIENMDYLAAAASIALIEARHAGFLNGFQQNPVTANVLDVTSDNSFEGPLTAGQVVEQAGAFIADLNGGPPVGYDLVVTPDNDIDILNFALALEYLEAEYYNINVPKFYG